MISLAVLAPQPPLLVPQLTGALGSSQVDELRTACRTAVTRLADAAPDWVVLAAEGADRRTIGPDAVGTFRGYGVDVRVSLGPGDDRRPADPDLPLGALIAGWLRGEAAPAARATVELLPTGLPTAECVRLGRDLAARYAGPDPVGLLVLGDGSTRHPERGPGGSDERAAGYDAALGDTFAAADAAALLELDAPLAADLAVQGRAAWQVAAAALLAAWPSRHGDLLYSAAPFGVGYHVAVWTPDAAPAH